MKNATVTAVRMPISNVDSPWMDTEQAALYLGCKSGTLKSWRSMGKGPKYRTVGGKLIRYHRDELNNFMLSGRD